MSLLFLFNLSSFFFKYFQKFLKRRSSVDMRRESVSDVLEKPPVPLKEIGKIGTPARIVEIPENVTVVESDFFFFK
jgi:hypothetical protein